MHVGEDPRGSVFGTDAYFVTVTSPVTRCAWLVTIRMVLGLFQNAALALPRGFW
jgi:hypothetical protein